MEEKDDIFYIEKVKSGQTNYFSYLVEKYQYMWEGHLIDKTVRFYLAEVTPEYTLQSEEIAQGKWMPLKDLLSYATFEEEKNLYLALIKSLAS